MSTDEVRYPVWSDVGIPKYLVEVIKKMQSSPLLDYLAAYRVFQLSTKIAWNYKCHACGHCSRKNRSHDDASLCEMCRSPLITCQPQWRMNKDSVGEYSTNDGTSSDVISRVAYCYNLYFSKPTPPDFLHSGWRIKKGGNVKLTRRRKAWNSEEQPAGKAVEMTSVFEAKFICGDLVTGQSPTAVLVKAAILCPFLWDDSFDWKRATKKDERFRSHIIPLLNMWTVLSQSHSGYGNRPRRVGDLGIAPENVWAVGQDGGYPNHPPAGNQLEMVDGLAPPGGPDQSFDAQMGHIYDMLEGM